MFWFFCCVTHVLVLENCYAQSILNSKTLPSGGLNAVQNAKYTKVLTRDTHSALHFVSVKIDTTIFDSTGKVLVSLPEFLPRNFTFILNQIKLADVHKIPFNVGSLSPGIYFLNIKTKTTNETKRIVIEWYYVTQ